MNFVEDIDWSNLVESWTPQQRNSSITPNNLRKRFKRLIVYRIPFQNQLNFNDIIDLLMTHFVQPFRDGKIDLINVPIKEDPVIEGHVQDSHMLDSHVLTHNISGEIKTLSDYDSEVEWVTKVKLEPIEKLDCIF